MIKPEQVEQIKLFNWIHSIKELSPYCFHVANERRCSPQHGRILKRMGVRSGVSDNFIGIARGHYHGMFLEMKVGSNSPTENQEQFMLDMASQGYYCIWASGFEHAKKCILTYMSIESIKP